MLGFGIATVAAYINDTVKSSAKEKIKKWFGDVDDKELNKINHNHKLNEY